ncbi:type III secretion system translocon subunit VopB [Vibrio parahaemolyticus]|uniref:type III secretion system translocon subunit VopB n=1 Tax=Vibrio parahaemolyticus TaxID=670 RepID=UPI0004DF505B|nr:type III secretion system translocon subunit VopB [Vibrio parahaemolyticus]EKQ5901629.1 type III secretion system translocon subunit VopB [Vibrio parahaemolyticus]ELA8136739.1 type III secretion system translocon subunit VopB [Vibrio parahaemolyticus]MBD6983274.1 type III secretion system translocon subunit VopB [Vibrio parahaemolyticus]MBD6987281.1 type III secretion system translocon subunit VopB [Vibrio parahaemolyticus]HBC3364424.1 type III secretion system translocon subunit VopB [Vibr
MSSIALDRTQTQVYIPESGQTTLENVQKTASTATPSVTVENVKSRDADTLNTGRVKVQLDAPNAAVSDKVTDLTLKAMVQLQKIVDTIAKALHAVADQTGSIAVKIIAGSADDFEVELAAITDKLKSAQNELKIQEVKVAKAKHEQEMAENQEKIKESEAAAKEAQKSGLASKIFGWISAVVSIVVGAIMVATGVGAAAGALMIAGGVMGAVSMALQEPAVQDALKEAGVNVDVLSKVVMGLEIAVALIGAAVTFGGAVAGGIAKVANMASKVANMGSKAATTTAKAIRYGAETVDLTVNIGKGATDSVHAANNANVTEIQADITDLRAKMTLSQAVIDKLKEEIGKLMEDFQELMSIIMQMIQAKSETMQTVLSRPATV